MKKTNITFKELESKFMKWFINLCFMNEKVQIVEKALNKKIEDIQFLDIYKGQTFKDAWNKNEKCNIHYENKNFQDLSCFFEYVHIKKMYKIS